MSTAAVAIPGIVTRAQRRARDLGFELSCEDEVGALLAALAAAAPVGARIVELGTGAGVGLAWLVHGLGARDDAEVVTVDVDRELQSSVAEDGDLLSSVRFVVGDGADVVGKLAPVDLLFADAPGGKIDGLDRSLAALAPRGVLVVDDMDVSRHADDGLADAIDRVRDALVAHPDVIVAELRCSSGVIVATRRAAPA